MFWSLRQCLVSAKPIKTEVEKIFIYVNLAAGQVWPISPSDCAAALVQELLNMEANTKRIVVFVWKLPNRIWEVSSFNGSVFSVQGKDSLYKQEGAKRSSHKSVFKT